MEALMNSITEKPDWRIKVLNKDIVDRWRKDAMDQGANMTATMIDWVSPATRSYYPANCEIISSENGDRFGSHGSPQNWLTALLVYFRTCQ
jgi:Protein of unknown function (DUF4246)